MSITRRNLLAGAGGLAATAALGRLSKPLPGATAPGQLEWPTQDSGFPRKDDFAIPEDYTYINGAFTHPMPLVALEAVRQRAEQRSAPGSPRPDGPRRDPKELFADLINAEPSEIAYVPNTSTGENLVVDALGIEDNVGNVVTDALHFDGSLVHLMELEKRGLDLRIVEPRDYRIELEDLERVIDDDTRLVELSLVAMYNGFQHDLEAVCELAHAHGAYVYADIIQGAGAVPIDVKASGVDFCSGSSFKWLMGDFGIGFLYAREELLGEVAHRSHWGYHSVRSMSGNVPPFDEAPDGSPVTWELRNDATGFFETGSIASGPAAAVGASLEYILGLGVERIQEHRQPLLRRLHEEMPGLGFTPVTPPESTSPIITFAKRNVYDELGSRLEEARVDVRVSRNWLRLSPSVYNDMDDIERFLEAIA